MLPPLLTVACYRSVGVLTQRTFATVALFFQIAVWANNGDAVFIREFTLIRRDHLAEEPLHDGSQKPEDPVSLKALLFISVIAGENTMCHTKQEHSIKGKSSFPMSGDSRNNQGSLFQMTLGGF